MDKVKKTSRKDEKDESTENNPWLSEWTEFDDERYEYVNWTVIDANKHSTDVQFESDAPCKFVNKWGREQWKILVVQNGSQKWLSGGKRLFECIKRLCKECNLPPRRLNGIIRIIRIGKSVECSYVAECIIPP